MSKVSDLKAEARREEAAGNHRRAIQLYLRALEEGRTAEYATPDPGLSVRIADLNFREGEPGRAIEYYRQAADLYAEQGLITNAIAVCNKILRVFPYEIECYRTMARLHLEVGLVAEARKNLLHYVDTVSQRGEPRAARVAMRDFLERAPDEEVAVGLARSLLEDGHRDEALSTLRGVWFDRAARGESNTDLASRIREVFPSERPESWQEEQTPAGTDASAEPETAPPMEVEPLADFETIEPEEFEEEPADFETEPEGFDSEPEGFDEELEEEPETLAAEAEEAKPEERRVPELHVYQYEVSRDIGAAPEHAAGPEQAEAEESDEIPESGEAEVERHARPEWAVVGANRLELVGQYRDLMSRARSLASEFGREPPSWTDALDEDGEGPNEPIRPSPSFPEIESGGPMPDEDRTESEHGFGSEWERWLAGRVDESDAFDEAAVIDEHEVTEEREVLEESQMADEFESAWESEEFESDDEFEAATEAEEFEAAEEFESDDELEAADESAEEPSTVWEPAGFQDQEEEPAHPMDEEEEEPEMNQDDAFGIETAGAETSGVTALEAEPEEERSPANGRMNGRASGTGASTELGEKAELRRGLQLLDELLELTPDNMDLRRRKVAYARRLADDATLGESYLALAEGMAERGSRRSARILYEQVLSLDEDNETALAGLARLDAVELQEKRRQGGSESDLPQARPADRAARAELGQSLWQEFEMTIRELPWLHAATQSFQAVEADRQPAPETFLMMAHYFMARDRYDQAAEVLAAALELSERDDAELVDILYYLGVARQRQGDQSAADQLFARVAAVDADFRESLEILGD